MRTFLVLMAAAFGLIAINAPGAPPADSLAHGAVPLGEEVHARAARADFRGGHYEDAAAIYQQMADDHPDSLFAWSNLGITLFQVNKLKEARDALQHAIDINPRDGPSVTVLGITEYELGSFQEAIDTLKTAVALTPADATAHEYLGGAYESAGLKAEAKAERKIASDLEEAAVDQKTTPAPAK